MRAGSQKTLVLVLGPLAALMVLFLTLRTTDDALGPEAAQEAGGAMASASDGSRTSSLPQGEDRTLEAPPSRGDGDSELSGLVVSGGEGFKEGASVCAQCLTGACSVGPDLIWCVRSDERGAFTIADLVEGRYALTAEAAGYRTAKDAPSNLQRLEAAQKIDEIELRLEPGGGWVRGRVVDDLGRPIESAWVHEAGNRGTDRVVETTAQGDFELWLQGETSVHFEAPGHARGVEWINPPRDDLELVLSPGGAARGRVVDPEGSPVEGAAVHFIHMERPQGVSRAKAFSGADGTFLVEGLWLGAYHVQVGGKWFHEEASSFVSTAGEVAGPLEIRVRRGVDVRGIVLEEESRTPCPDAVVSIHTSDGGAAKRLAADASGRIVFEGVMPGTYEVDARCGAMAAVHPLPRIVVGEAPSDEEHQWFVESGTELVGTVKDAEGQPVEGVRVVYSAMNQSGLWSGEVRTDAIGAFEIEGLPSATFELYAVGKTREHSRAVHVDTPHREPVSLTLPAAGTIELTVVDSAGRPVRGAAVDSDGQAWPVGFVPHTDHDGILKLGASPGRVTLRTNYPGLNHLAEHVVEHAVNVRAGRVAKAKMKLPNHTAFLAGLVVDGDGQPVIGANLKPWPVEADWRDPARAHFSSRADGSFRIERIPHGTYNLLVRAPHGGFDVVETDAPSESIRVTVPDSAGIELEVRQEDDVIPPVFLVEVEGADGRRAMYRGYDGTFTFPDLGAGVWNIEVEAGEFIGTVEAELAAGETKKVPLELSRGGIVSGRLVDGVSGEPAGDRSVIVRGEGKKRFVMPGSYGLFESRPGRPGTYRISTLGGRGYCAYNSDPFEVPSGGIDLGDIRLTPADEDCDE